MKRSELKSIIREAIEEVMNEFAPLGVAETRLDEKAPPNFPKALHDKLLKQYKDDESKAYATMWKIFHANNSGNKKVNEMWTAWEAKSKINEASEEQNAEHDETDLSNPEENKEVELAKKIKALANDLLSMHGVESEEGAEGEEDNTEEAPKAPESEETK
jgi:hypothetical protein